MELAEVERRYLYVNKRYGTLSGVWPYGSNRLKWIGRTTMILFALISLATQFARIIHELGTDVVIEQCPFVVFAIGLILKEGNYIVHEDKLKELYQSLYKDWTTKRSDAEIDIMHKYAERGLFFCNIYFATACACYLMFSMVAIAPRILDIVSPKNESREIMLIYPAYYGVDEEQYYYAIMAHMLTVITVIFIVFVSCDSTYMTIVQHACGLLNISGYRFMLAVKNIHFKDEKHGETVVNEVYQTVRNSVMMHQYAIQYVTKIQEIHKTYLFIAVALIMLTFSITLVKTSLMEPCMEYYKFCGFLVAQLVHLLFLSLQGHFIIVSNDAVYNSIYAGLWYNSTPKTQALYALALRRNLTPPVLSAAGLMTLNLEAFAEVIKASVSYFTVLKSA